MLSAVFLCRFAELKIMKRISVHKMLKQRLANSKASIKNSFYYEDLVTILGGDNSKESQHRINMQKDIEQLEFLLKQLETFKSEL